MTRFPDRYFEVLASNGLRGFDRQRGDEVPPHRWRVSSDEWDRLMAFAEEQVGTVPAEGVATFVLGYPIEADSGLPPNSVVFEAVLS